MWYGQPTWRKGIKKPHNVDYVVLQPMLGRKAGVIETKSQSCLQKTGIEQPKMSWPHCIYAAGSFLRATMLNILIFRGGVFLKFIQAIHKKCNDFDWQNITNPIKLSHKTTNIKYAMYSVYHIINIMWFFYCSLSFGCQITSFSPSSILIWFSSAVLV